MFPLKSTAFAVLATATAIATATPYAEAAPGVQDRVFDPLCVSQIHLTAPQSSIDALYADPKGEYQPATMTFDLCGEGTQVFGPSAVTFRLKGSGSFRTLDGKAAFKVKMPSGSRIDGLKSFTLNNMVQDPSMIHESLAFETFRAAGVTASRAGYATVTLNGADYGLHANIETIDSRFLAGHFASTRHLYEQPDWMKGNGAIESRDVLPENVAEFEVDEGDEGDLADLTALAAISVLEDDEEWWAAFQASYDVERVLRFWAVETYVGNVDGYSSNANNFYLHSTAGGVFTFMPWGLDRSFTGAFRLDGTDAAGVVTRRCIDHPDCRARFAIAMDAVVSEVQDLSLVSRAREIHTAIAAAVAADTRRETSVREQCLATNDTIAFIAAREDFWNEEHPHAGASQDARRFDCGVSTDPDSTTPTDPSPTDKKPPHLLSARARRAGSAVYRLRVVASDDQRVSTIQIRTRGNHTITRTFPPDGRLTIKTTAHVIRIRVLDATGNAGTWHGLRLPR